MSAVAEKTLLTPEDLLARPDEKHYELIDGELVERTMGALAGWVGGKVHRHLDEDIEPRQLGWAFPSEVGYRCFPDSPRTVREPDVSFVRSGRLPDEQLPEGYLSVAPDLVVEVISPTDLAIEVDEKVEKYLNAGIRLTWVVNSTTRTVRIHRADRTFAFLREGDELSGEDVFPGFRCPVSSIFPSRPAAGG